MPITSLFYEGHDPELLLYPTCQAEHILAEDRRQYCVIVGKKPEASL